MFYCFANDVFLLLNQKKATRGNFFDTAYCLFVKIVV